ncbi:hypothetical protein BpHYR1_017862 [Brachionus plicatilis]|uniref:Uncharacterized protein n=1 Tax=Brachionus plicatilis TaxID=10195 RepID=A0A3M7QZ97_BRAPC|nr:hypothetical protein BpHYR1_017862 [Brachionus plicatilis]
MINLEIKKFKFLKIAINNKRSKMTRNIANCFRREQRIHNLKINFHGSSDPSRNKNRLLEMSFFTLNELFSEDLLLGNIGEIQNFIIMQLRYFFKTI